MTRICAQIARSPIFQRVIIGTIALAIALVGLETDAGIMEQVGPLIRGLDRFILGVFAVEAIVKILAQGKRPWRYFQDPWNTFDFLILVCLLLPFWGSFFVLLRVGRLLRILRVVTAFPRLRMLIATLINSLPSMGYILLILGLLFYVYGVAGTFLFGTNDPVHFGSLGVAMLSLFTVVTLEGWTVIMNIQLYGCDRMGYENFPGLCTAPEQFPIIAPLFFISFVLMGAMVVLNLFVGVIISSMMESMETMVQEAVHPESRSPDGSSPSQPPSALTPAIHAQLRAVDAKLHTIQTYIQSLRREMDALGKNTQVHPPNQEGEETEQD